jgi:hypothetical protein
MHSAGAARACRTGWWCRLSVQAAGDTAVALARVLIATVLIATDR